MEANLAILVSDRLLRAAPAIPPSPIVNMQNAKSGQVENGSVDKLCIVVAEGTSTVNLVAIAPADGFTLWGGEAASGPGRQTRAGQGESLAKPVLRRDRDRQGT
jgi:hypothetical protein